MLQKIKDKLGICDIQSGKALFWQFFKFGLVGVSNSVIYLGVYYLLLTLKLHYIPAYIIAFFLSVVNAFFWHSNYVFKTGKNRSAFVKCLLAYSFTFVFGLIFIFVLVEIAGVSEKIAPLLNLVVTVPTNFLLNKLWAFKVKGKEGSK